MKRRSFLTLLGLAPLGAAVGAVIAAPASSPELSITIAGLYDSPVIKTFALNPEQALAVEEFISAHVRELPQLLSGTFPALCQPEGPNVRLDLDKRARLLDVGRLFERIHGMSA